MSLEKQIGDWERIKALKEEIKRYEGHPKKVKILILYDSCKEYLNKYKVKFNPFNKPK